MLNRKVSEECRTWHSAKEIGIASYLGMLVDGDGIWGLPGFGQATVPAGPNGPCIKHVRPYRVRIVSFLELGPD